MSKYETKPNSGSLFKNEKKESDNHPDYTGSALIDGTDYWMNAWLKSSESGRKWMSFSFKPKEEAKPSKPASKPQRLEDMDSDTPF